MADIATQEAEPIWLNGFLDKIVSKILSVFEAKKAEPAVVADEAANGAKAFSRVQHPEDKNVVLDASHYEKRIADLEKTISDITKGISVKLDEAVARDGIVDAVKAVLPEADLKGKSNSEIKTVLIKSVLPDVKLDSAEMIDVYYNASLEFAKAKAKLNPGKTEIKQDEADLTALKTKRLNLYQGAK